MGRNLSDFKTRITAAAAAVFSTLVPLAAKPEAIDEHAQALGLTDYGRASVVTRRLAETQPVIIEAESFDEDYNAPKRPALLTPADLAPPIIYVLTGEEPEGAFIGVG